MLNDQLNLCSRSCDIRRKEKIALKERRGSALSAPLIKLTFDRCTLDQLERNLRSQRNQVEQFRYKSSATFHLASQFEDFNVFLDSLNI